MSLMIDVDRIIAVLLADDWHKVEDASFTLDSYEYIWWPSGEHRERGDFDLLHAGGRSDVCATGFRFRTGNPTFTDQGEQLRYWLHGPLTTRIAVSGPWSRRSNPRAHRHGKWPKMTGMAYERASLRCCWPSRRAGPPTYTRASRAASTAAT